MDILRVGVMRPQHRPIFWWSRSLLLALCFAGPVLLLGNRCLADEVARSPPDRTGGIILAVNVTLVWKTSDDLDLSVICPDGKRIAWDTKNNCGGAMDVDSAGKSASQSEAAENIGWLAGAAPAGLYKVEVSQRSRDNFISRNPIDFSVELRIDGKLVEQHSRQINARKMSAFEFTLPYAGR
jgi:hypothetical protein